MQLTCSRCRRVLEYSLDRPRFCAYCGSSLGDDPRLEATAAYESGEATAAYRPSPTGPEPGLESVAGYRLLRSLGRGGMGTVYEAEDVATGRRVAMKLIAPELVGSAEAIERFRQEGRLAATLAHPRCVFVYAADEESGRPYIVMELMSGTTLRDLVHSRGPLDPEQAVLRILDVIDGLQEAHALGIVHRDVKPSNCFVEPDGRVKIGDFGLSRSLLADSSLTRTGAFLGTPLYASPEQIRRDPVDSRADVYSVAATLYFLLTGRAPFEQDDPTAAMARIVSEPVPPIRAFRRGVPRPLERVVLKGLQRDRGRRWRDLAAFRAALLPFVPGRLTLGGIGRRLAAFSADFLLVRLPLLAAVDRLFDRLGLADTRGVGPFRANTLAALAAWAAYLAVGDGIAGATIGKRLMRLRVCVASTGGPPGLARGALRTILFLGASYVAFGLSQALHPPHRTAVGDASFLVGFALLFATARVRNGYRGVHELLSDTRVISPRNPGRPRAPRSAAVAPRPAALPTRPEGLPEAVGPYEIRGALRWDAAARVLLGEDPALGRSVWVVLRPADEPPSPPARHAVDRLTRPRWLGGGPCDALDGLRWEAYVVSPGRTLPDAVAGGRPLSWGEARPLLEGLAEELARASAEGTLPDPLAPEQVWLLPEGRVQLLDVAPEPVGALAGPAGGTDQERALGLLREVVVLALEGRRLEPGRPEGPVRAPIPLHASKITDRLLRPRGGYRDLVGVRDDLERTHDLPTRLTATQHAAKLLTFLLIILLGSIALFGVLLGPAMWSGGRLDAAIEPLSNYFNDYGTTLFAALWTGWAYLTRGGFTRPLMGIALVGADGRPASRLRCAGRELLLWLPLAVIAMPGFPRWFEGYLPASVVEHLFEAAPLLVLLIQLGYASLHSGRLLHDRLAGTYLVPR